MRRLIRRIVQVTLAACLSSLLLGQNAKPAASAFPAWTPIAPELGGPSPENYKELHRPAHYPVQYEAASTEQIAAVMDRVLAYLEIASAPSLFDRDTKTLVKDPKFLPEHVGLASHDFMLTSYEWGVTYAGMIAAGQTTGNARYNDYVAQRLGLVGRLYANSREREKSATKGNEGKSPAMSMGSIGRVLRPSSLDDSGAMCAAAAKAVQAGIEPELIRPLADNYITYISKGQYRFEDGTLARHRPMQDSLWLDDLYMSVPALAQMGQLTGNKSYVDDAARQVIQFSERMFIKEKGLYRHGWIKSMKQHPSFHWGRANGWALMAMAELLSVMPEDHPDRVKVMELYQAQAAALAACQDSSGLWHQLLDRPDSYLETSASAMFVFGIARGINRGWLDADAYTPCVSLGWNAVAVKINDKGQVEGTCVGTGMGFDPAFYYFRPVSVFAAHGYGPVLLAGSEMLVLRKGVGQKAQISDGALHNSPLPLRF